MKNIAFWFIALATLFALTGMAFGIWMSISGDHTLAPAHAHHNLIGWVTLALYGFYYHAVPEAGRGRLAMVHFWLAVLGALTLGPGIILAINAQSDLLAPVAEALTIAAMALFVWIVFANKPAMSAE